MIQKYLIHENLPALPMVMAPKTTLTLLFIALLMVFDCGVLYRRMSHSERIMSSQ
jgi:hypothetical protein